MTLVELVIALGLSSVVTLGVWQLLDLALRLTSRGAGQTAAQQAVRVALDRMADQIRQATAIVDLDPNRLVIADQAEGGAGPPLVTFVAGHDGTLLERGASSQAVKYLIDGKDAYVRNLAFAYYDTRGRLAESAGAIRLVRITLTAESVRGRAPRGQPAFTITTMVGLRAEP